MFQLILITLILLAKNSLSISQFNNLKDNSIFGLLNPCQTGECVLKSECPVVKLIPRINNDDNPCNSNSYVCCQIKRGKPKCGERNNIQLESAPLYNTTDDNNDAKNAPKFGEFPWITSIMVKETIGNMILWPHECAGTLIEPSVILTVAHCVKNKSANTLKVRAGIWKLGLNHTIYPNQDRGVKKIIIHEEFDIETFSNDIALLILDSPMNLMDHINTICLPSEGFQINNNNTDDGDKCIGSGWGSNTFGGQMRTFLKLIELPLVDRMTCVYRIRRQLGPFVLPGSLLCAGGNAGHDMCTGDGGAPLMCTVPETKKRQIKVYYQIGMVAAGFSDCGNGIPGVYTDLAYFRHWIDQEIEKENLKRSYYVFTE